VYFVDQVNNGNARGSTKIRLDSAHNFDLVTIHIAVTYRQNDMTIPMKSQDYLTTLAHEFGHALGIYDLSGSGGHSSNKNDVMFPDSKYWTLTKGD